MADATTIQGRTVSSAAPARGDAVKWNSGASEWQPGRPCPPGWYDPRDYGATFTGNSASATDDLAAFQAMLADVPTTGGHVHMSGMAWLSNTLHLTKPVKLIGNGGNGRFQSGFRVAPGKTALMFDDANTSGDGNSSAGHVLSHIDVRSQILIHVNANGSALGYGIDGEYPSQPNVRLGDCFVAAAGANPTRFYRATAITANGGKGPGLMTTTPAWPLTPGGTVTTNGITWTTEAFPFIHQISHAYIVGERVYATADQRFIFRCTTAGTSSATRPDEFIGGDGVFGITLGGTVTDGTCVWTVETAAGVLIRSNTGDLQKLYVAGFTGPGLFIVGGTGAYADGGGLSDANCERARQIYVEYCGVGAYYAGDNCNGWTLDQAFMINIGTLQPTPNAAAGAGYTGLSGHCIVDRSLGSGIISGLYAQLSTGRPILKTGIGRLTCVSNYTEVTGFSKNTNGVVSGLGGNLHWTDNSANVSVLDGATLMRGIREEDPSGTQTIRTALVARDGKSLYTFQANQTGGTPNFYAMRWTDPSAPTGFWAMVSSPQRPNAAYLLSDADTTTDPGPGWLAFPRGSLVGSTVANMLFRGSLSAFTFGGLRSGVRKVGDVFESGTTKLTVRADGLKGSPWLAGPPGAGNAGYAPWGIPPDFVEPTTNTGKTGGGEQVWRVTTAGTPGGAEPAWPASPVAGVTTLTDGTQVYTYAGTTPRIDVMQSVDKATIPTRLGQAQTTTATAAQVIFSGGVVEGVDLALPPDSMVLVTDAIVMRKASTANGGSIKVESTWARNGTGAPTLIGSIAVAYKLSGATLDGTTATHVANGNRIELRVSPESADTLHWRVFRTQATGVD